MKIKTEEKYNAVVLEIRGNAMGGAESEEFGKILHQLLDEGKKNVIVDLADVKFMNSSGLGMLISGYTTMKNGQGRLVLANATEKIESLLVITKLYSIFENFDSIDEALEGLKETKA